MPKELVKRVMGYKYDELSDDAKDKALEALYDINVDGDWWYESTMEDASMVGLKIEEFDVYRNTIKGYFTQDARDVIVAIQDNHGKDCDTYKLAVEYEGRLYKVDEDGDEIEDEDKVAEFLHDLLEEYLSMFRKEYEYLTSRKAIKETIRVNEYDFTVDGKFPAI